MCGGEELVCAFVYNSTCMEVREQFSQVCSLLS